MTREKFDNYVKLTARKLYFIAFRILRKQEEAEDAVQEVFIRMWRMGDKLDDYSSIDALAATMIRNYCIDQLRKSTPVTGTVESIMEKADHSTTEGMLENAESFTVLQKIISNLPMNYREVVKLRDIEGYSYEEIAKMTGQNINTIRVNLSRARAAVRVEYTRYYNEKRRN